MFDFHSQVNAGLDLPIENIEPTFHYLEVIEIVKKGESFLPVG